MTTKGAILKAIRENCLSCCNGSVKEVEICTVGDNQSSTIGRCQLYPYRMGKDPKPSRRGNIQNFPRTDGKRITNEPELIGIHNPVIEGGRKNE